MKRAKIIFSFIFICISLSSIGQIDEYKHRRKISQPGQGWYSIVLPDELYENIETEFFDIRILGFHQNDTIEAPYLVYSNIGETHFKLVDFNVINRSKKGDTFFYTFQVDPEETINEIKLNFENENFDWKVKLEGSQDQQEWFTILDDHRILSIRNETEQYEFSKLMFPESNYKYYRVSFVSEKEPDFSPPSITKFEVDSGKHKVYDEASFEITENDKTTEIRINLNEAKPVSKLALQVSDTFDYYRPMEITCVTDSLETENGWTYNRKKVFSGKLSSMETHQFSFNPVVTKQIMVKINNGDNQSLDINDVIVKGNIVELITRITEAGEYFLYYGNEKAKRPNYDIAMFKEKIPENLEELSLSEEEKLFKTQKAGNPIYEKIWLWIVMALVVIFLGAFTFKMMRKN